LAIAETADHPFSLADISRELGYLYIRMGEISQAIALLERGLALARSRDLTLWLPSIGSARLVFDRNGAAGILRRDSDAKAIAHPTDARLCHRALEKLMDLAQRNDVRLRQSFRRVGPSALLATPPRAPDLPEKPLRSTVLHGRLCTCWILTDWHHEQRPTIPIAWLAVSMPRRSHS
jgi:hypothetical protein